MNIIDKCLEDIRTEKALALGVCPVVEALYHGTQGDVNNSVTIFCTRCPDAEDIPITCPELAGSIRKTRVCVLYRGPTDKDGTPQGKCPYAQPERKVRCTCFTKKSDEWYKAFNAWNESRNATGEDDGSDEVQGYE